MARTMSRTLFAMAGALLLSTAAYAQSAIVGAVKDSSGAAMPGVTVEAASDVPQLPSDLQRPGTAVNVQRNEQPFVGSLNLHRYLLPVKRS